MAETHFRRRKNNWYNEYLVILGSADKSCEMATPRGSMARPKVTPKEKATETANVASPMSASKVVKPPGVSCLLECAGRWLLDIELFMSSLPSAECFPRLFPFSFLLFCVRDSSMLRSYAFFVLVCSFVVLLCLFCLPDKYKKEVVDVWCLISLPYYR